MMKLRLSNDPNKFALVDDDDFARLSTYNWSESAGRIRTWLNGKNVSLARVVMQQLDIMFDHKDRDFLNNQKENLRPASSTQNNHNKAKMLPSTLAKKFSFYKGVTWRQERRKWRARITKDGKRTHIGLFDSEVEAARAYNQKAIELYKDFAALNDV